MNSLKIGNKEYNLRYGIAFVKEVNNLYAIDYDVNSGLKMKMNFGISILMEYLRMGDVIAIVNAIKCATVTEKSKPSDIEIEEFISELSQEEYTKLCTDFFTSLEEAPFLKNGIQKLLSK